MFKKLLIGFLFVSPLFAEGTNQPQIIGPFLGLQNRDNSAVIPVGNAQDLLNVDLSIGGKSVKKREGFGLAYALSKTTSPVHGIYDFYDASGNDVALAFNDVNMTATINGASTSVLLSTGPNGATYQCTDSQGFAYCVNTTRNNVIKTNGVTFSNLAPASTGTMVAVTPDRLVLAGFSEAPNRVDFSASGDFTTWTTGISPTSAFNFTITAPGSKITHICYAFNRVMWFKDNSFGYILPGQTQSDWIVLTVSPNVGTLDNTSIYWQGILYFRGQDSNIYSYDGSNLQDITREIGGTIDASQTHVSNSWTQSLASEFAAGTLNTGLSTGAVDNSVAFSTNVYYDRFTDGDYTSNPVWTPYRVISSTWFVGNNELHLQSNGDPESAGLWAPSPVSTTTAGGFRFVYYSTQTAKQNFSFKIGNRIPTGYSAITDPPAEPGFYTFRFLYKIGVSNSYSIFIGTNSSTGGTTPVELGDGNKHLFSFDWSPNGRLSFSIDNSPKVAFYDATISSITHISFAQADSGVGNDRVQKNFTDVGFVYFSSTYTSPVKNAVNITAWDAFNATALGNSQSFSIRSSSNTFSIASSTPAWVSITNGQIPTVSTGSAGVFFQVRDVFSRITSTDTPILSDFTQNWFEGAATDKAYATYFKDNLWFSIASGTGATTNNRILKYDLINSTWLLYDIPINGFYVRNNSLYFGGATSGNVFKYGGADNDNGSAINAYWKSKDFFGASPFVDEDMTDFSVFFSAVTGSSMTVTYTIVGSSSTSFTVPLGRPNASFGVHNRNLPLGTTGNTFNVKFGNNAADQPFEVFSLQYGVNPKPWKPGNQ